MRHKHYDCIVAWAEGENIQVKDNNFGGSQWLDVENPTWSIDSEYRIKKEPLIEVVYFRRDLAWMSHHYQEIINPDLTPWDLKITYQDSKAIKAEFPE
jgi:hypothetical protein